MGAIMKILIINPNIDLEMTEAIKSSAQKYVNGQYSVDCLSAPNGPFFIATYEHQMQAADGMVKLIRENEDKYDAFIIACHADPNLDLCKEITNKPVVGIGEASMKIASMLGHKFSVISPVDHSIPNKEAMAHKYHLDGLLASVRAPLSQDKNMSAVDKLLEAATLAIEKDKAEVVVLGCAGMTGVDKIIQKKLSVPVLDGVVCALIIANGLANYGVSISKARRYNPEF